MPKYEIKAVDPFAYGERIFVTGELLGSIETELSPVMLLEFQRAGRATIVSPDAPPYVEAAAKAAADESAEASGGEALESLDAAGGGSTEATESSAPAELPGESTTETPGGHAASETAPLAAVEDDAALDPPLDELEPEAPAAKSKKR